MAKLCHFFDSAIIAIESITLSCGHDILNVGACSVNFIPILLKYFLNYQSQFLTTKRISFTTKSSKEN